MVTGSLKMVGVCISYSQKKCKHPLDILIEELYNIDITQTKHKGVEKCLLWLKV